ncbi:MAG: hypothetical protein ACD_58C00330G0001 [uncultured bacterium]|nr:MAG: hypothetical protein ACD_58C00330G0001 [uncultured bacterium]
MAKITQIKGRKILDSRGDYTIEVDVYSDDGTMGRASIPSGASTGRYEAFKLTDIDQVIANIGNLEVALVGQEITDQEKIDLLMINSDGTANKSKLGGNTILAISLAVCEAAAKSEKIPLYKYIARIYGVSENNFRMPIPMFNIINGGKHADNNLPFQEFMIIPMGQKTIHERVFEGDKVFKELKAIIKKMGLSTSVGDEGGFAPRLNSNEEALELLKMAITNAGYVPKQDMGIGIDVAASSIPDLSPITYPLSPIDYYKKISTKYPVVLIEDGLSEDDWANWELITQTLGSQVKIIGDDLFTTNSQRLQMGIDRKAANGIIIKPDQIGTLTETFKTIKLAKQAGYTVIISHRSGETESTFIADLSVGVGAEFIKTGAPDRGERVAKYNQLLRIEEELM